MAAFCCVSVSSDEQECVKQAIGHKNELENLFLLQVIILEKEHALNNAKVELTKLTPKERDKVSIKTISKKMEVLLFIYLRPNSKQLQYNHSQ